MVRTIARVSRHQAPPLVVVRAAALVAGVVALAALIAAIGWAPEQGPAPGPAHPPRALGSSPPTTPRSPGATPGATSTTRRAIFLVGLGDSVTAGSACGCVPFMQRFATLVSARDGVVATASNLGIPGLTTATLADQLGQPGTARSVADADTVVLTIGANDLSPLEDRWEGAGCAASCIAPAVHTMSLGLAADLARIRALGHAGQRVEVTTYWNVFEDGDVADQKLGPGFADWSNGVTLSANRAICQVAKTYGDTCVDLYAPFLSADGTRNPTALLSPDGDHPNAAGHDLIARTLLAATPA